MKARVPWLAIVLATFAACDGALGDGDTGPLDTGTDAALEGPDLPWRASGSPAVLTPCPEGWREVVDGQITTCDPFPEGGASACDAGEAHHLGGAGCTLVGDACPVDAFASTLPTDTPVVYVRADAPSGGDGSLGAPWARLGDVPWSSLDPGTTVALGRGTYDGSLPLRAGVHVVGACARETILTGVAAPVLAVVTVTNAGEPAVVRNVTIADAPQYASAVTRGRALRLEGVIIDAAKGIGLFVEELGSVIELVDSVVRDTRPTDEGFFGRGAAVELGGTLVASRAIFENNLEVAISAVRDGSTIRLTDVIVRDTQPEPATRAGGRGIVVQDDAVLEATRVVVERNRDIGIFAGPTDLMTLRETATEVTLTDVIVRDSLPEVTDDAGGNALFIGHNARVTASRLLAERSHDVAILAYGDDSVVVLEDTIVRDTRARTSDGQVGRGIAVQFAARLEASRVLVEGSRDIGIFIHGASSAVLTDVAIRDTLANEGDGTGGSGIHAQLGSSVTGRRILVERVREIALQGVADASLILEDVAIADVAERACAETSCADRGYGYGVSGISSTIQLSRFEIARVATCGIFVASGGDLPAPNVDLSGGSVAESTIGACVQESGYDLMRLQEGVQYRDNGVNLDSTTLPVPETLDAVEL